MVSEIQGVKVHNDTIIFQKNVFFFFFFWTYINLYNTGIAV